ncbi:hypothetical protein [Oerskovia turbata]|uniref:hypothetical protein n=1 Tax=Oerskovia turbata TaxID=1713 RepID=UPI0004C07BCB|nr:hypothetical protein [Oerskovia turbata]
MAKDASGDIERPLKITEYRLRFATREAEKGWRDLRATARNATVDAWDFLTKTPHEEGGGCYRLLGDLAVVRIDGTDFDRWQYKPTGGGRIWYAILPPTKGSKEPGLVLLERVTTGHPNQTLKNHR